MPNSAFVAVKDGNVVVIADRIEVYIPKSSFQPERIDKDIEHSAVATSVGDAFKIIALFNARIAMTEDDDIRKSRLYTFNYPQLVLTSPSESSEETLSLYPDEEPEPYVVLKYSCGDILMPARSPQNTDNCTKFLNLLVRGQIPRTIKYEDIFKLWKENLELNDANPGVPDSYLQFIIAALYRDKKNPSREFRFVYGKNMESNDYMPYNIRGIVSLTSVFSAQVFEHMSRMMTTSVTMSRNNTEQNRSPVEAVLWT